MKLLLKTISMLVCTLLLAGCGPSWKDAEKKIEEGDKQGAALILTKLADKGDVEAMKWLANYYADRYYLYPDSVNKLAVAEPWLLKSVEEGSSSGKEEWALYLIYSKSSRFKNESEALKWAASASKKGHFAASYVTGDNLFKNNKINEAIPLLEKVADKENPNDYQKQFVRDAAKDLYIIFTDSLFNHIDIPRGVKYGDIAASLGDPLAQYGMAIRYTYSDGVEEDIVKAYDYMQARGGLPDKELEANIIKIYNAEMKMREAYEKWQKAELIIDVFDNSGWIKRTDSRTYTKIFLGANDQIIIELNNAYGKRRAKFRYLADESSLDNFEPRIVLYQILDVSGPDYDWEEFLGNSYIFNVNDDFIRVTGDMLSGRYERLSHGS